MYVCMYVCMWLSTAQVCESLVQRFGADLNQSNHRGNTPLHYCFNFGHENIGQLLIDCGRSTHTYIHTYIHLILFLLIGADEYRINQHGLTCYEGMHVCMYVCVYVCMYVLTCLCSQD